MHTVHVSLVSLPGCRGLGSWVRPQTILVGCYVKLTVSKTWGFRAALLSLNKSVTELSTRISCEMLDLVTHCTLQRATS